MRAAFFLWIVLLPVLLGAVEIERPPYRIAHPPSPLDATVRSAFVRLLDLERRRVKPAQEVKDFLDEHSEAEIRVLPEAPGPGGGLRWEEESGSLIVPERLAPALAAGAEEGPSAEESADAAVRPVGPALLREAIRAQVRRDVPYPFPELFEEALLAFAYEGWFMKASKTYGSPALYASGEIRLDRDFAAEERLAAARSRRDAARRETEKEVKASQRRKVQKSKKLYDRAQARIAAARTRADKAQAAVDRLEAARAVLLEKAGSPPPELLDAAAVRAAFGRSWEDLARLVRKLRPGLPSLADPEGTRLERAKRARAALRRAKNSGDETRTRRWKIEAGFWSDKELQDRARAYFDRRLAAVKPFAGGGPPPASAAPATEAPAPSEPPEP